MNSKGFNQSLLANSSKVSQGSISAYLLGKRSPGAEELGKIANSLGVTMGWLWGTEDQQVLNKNELQIENVKLKAKLEMAIGTLKGALKSLTTKQ